MFKIVTPDSPIELTQYFEADFRNQAIRREVTQEMLNVVLSAQKSETVLGHDIAVSSSTLDITKHELVRPIPTPFYFRNLHGLGQLFITLDVNNPIDPKDFGTPKETFNDYYGFNSAIILQAGVTDPSRKYATVVASAIDPSHPVQPDVYLGSY